MTDSTDRVLASIDEAIEGYVSEDLAVSDDAMRWRPDAETDAAEGDVPDLLHTVEVSFGIDHVARERSSGWAGALRQALNLHRAIESGELTPRWTDPNAPDTWTELGHTTDGGFVYSRPVPPYRFGGMVPDAEAMRRSANEFGRAVSVGVEQMRPRIAEMGRALGTVGEILKAYGDENHPGIARLVYGDDYRWHRRACHLCNPAGNPKPLAGNGAEYRRRIRARRRRNRR